MHGDRSGCREGPRVASYVGGADSIRKPAANTRPSWVRPKDRVSGLGGLSADGSPQSLLGARRNKAAE